MTRIAHLADLHIGSPIEGVERLGLDPVESAYQALELVTDAVLGAGCEATVIAGDLFDRDVSTDRALATAEHLLDRLAAVGPVVVCGGNHDAVSTLPYRLRAIPGVTWLDTNRVQTVMWNTLGIAVHGRSLGRDEADDRVGEHPPPVPGMVNVGVLHTSLTGEWSRAICAPTTVERLTSHGYRAWLLGHVHNRRVFSVDPLVLYAGSTYARHGGEPGGHGFSIVDVNEDAVDVTHVDTAPVRFSESGPLRTNNMLGDS